MALPPRRWGIIIIFFLSSLDRNLAQMRWTLKDHIIDFVLLLLLQFLLLRVLLLLLLFYASLYVVGDVDERHDDDGLFVFR